MDRLARKDLLEGQVPLREPRQVVDSSFAVGSELRKEPQSVVPSTALLARWEVGQVRYTVTVSLTAVSELLESSIDSIMGELVHLANVDPQVSDPDIGADFSTRQVEFTVTVDADEEHAVPKALATIRTAIHTAGGATLDWPTFEPAQTISAELLDA